MSSITDLRGLFLHTLKDMYYAEKQHQKALGSLADKASDDTLTQQLRQHAEHGDQRIERLEKVFDLVGEKAEGVPCDAMDGILKEAKKLADEATEADTRDAALIMACQAACHYGITRYGTLATFATQLGMGEAADHLGQSLSAHEDADQKLTRLAEDGLNAEAV